MSDDELDGYIREVVGGNELIGPESVRASMRANGLRVQRRRVRESMVRINPAAAALRAIVRRPERRSY